MPEEKAICVDCGVEILATTASKTGGKCIPCHRGTRAQMEQNRRWEAENRRRRALNDEARERILQKARPIMADFLAEEDPLGVLWPVIVKTVFPEPQRRENIDALGSAARAIYLVECLAGEVINGGFHQYFSNSSGDHAREALQALAEVGAVETARLLDSAMGAFTGGRVPTDRLERSNELDAADGRQPGFFDGLDTQFYALEKEGPVVENLGELLLAFMGRYATTTVSAA